MKSDHELGMGRDITRRDFLQDSTLAALGLLAPMSAHAGQHGVVTGYPASGGRYYPPTRTGLRGSHPGSYDVAHALAREGRSFKTAQPTGEAFDLVVVGGGISGLSAALYYQDRFGKNARILILENHDDFGGHARRNEFHQGGEMRLALGGVHNLEYPSYSRVARGMLDRLGIDIDTLKRKTGFRYGGEGRGERSVYFDEESYGRRVLLKGVTLSNNSLIGNVDAVRQMPLSDEARQRLERFVMMDEHVMADHGWAEVEARLRAMPYFDFLREYGGLDDECVALFNNRTHGGEGFDAINLSAFEALEINLPGWNLLGQGVDYDDGWDYQMVMFPDGNASVARLMVRALIPAVSPGADFDNIAVADFDYGQLDRASHPVRLRLNATAVHVSNTPDGVAVNYASGGKTLGVTARHCVMACYHSIIPYLCPDLPEAQREAQRYQVKSPQLLTNVLLRTDEAVRRSGTSSVECPGRMHSRIYRWRGNTAGGYAQGALDNEGGPIDLVFWGSLEAPAGDYTLKERLRASRSRMLALTFEDYEREVRSVLDGLYGPYGLDVRRDVLAVTVNRWPHGYAYFYTDLWDPAFDDGAYPHQLASKPFGNITMANADAAADAYTHVAIDEAYRAIGELSDG
ncbi:MAG: FAD-dependent oxidoreductase [Pseudomonadota bacterium]